MVDVNRKRRILVKAEREIAAAHKRIALQKQLIAQLTADGHDSMTAETLLATMLQTVEAMESHRASILKALGLDPK